MRGRQRLKTGFQDIVVVVVVVVYTHEEALVESLGVVS